MNRLGDQIETAGTDMEEEICAVALKTISVKYVRNDG